MNFEELSTLDKIRSITLMHDFFIDRIIMIPERERFATDFIKKGNQGGGNLREMPTYDVNGGNAVNTAYSLCKLGVNVSLFTVANKLGESILHSIFSKFGNMIKLHVSEGKQGFTTVLEFPQDVSKSNVLISDVGDNENYGPEKISSSEALRALNESDAVMVLNWATNKKGSELASYAFQNSSHSLHFIDPSDLGERVNDFVKDLIDIAPITDILSINENEARILAKAIGLNTIFPQNYVPDDVKQTSKRLSDKIGISVDLHSRIGSSWSNGKESYFVQSFNVNARRVTGAGDCWNAADIIGYLTGLAPDERLKFANASAALFVSREKAEFPSLNEVLSFMQASPD